MNTTYMLINRYEIYIIINLSYMTVTGRFQTQMLRRESCPLPRPSPGISLCCRVF